MSDDAVPEQIHVEAPVDQAKDILRILYDINTRLKTPVVPVYVGEGVWRVESSSLASMDVVISELQSLGAYAEGTTLKFTAKPDETAVVLISGGKPALVFSSKEMMRRYLRKRGSFAGRAYTMAEVPFDPK